MALFQRFEAAIDAGIGRRRLGYALLALIIVYLLWFPNDTSQSNYAKTVFISGFFYAIMASSWALLAGIAGQFSFGHMAFMGIGAYVAGLVARDGLAFLTAESISSVGAIVIGTVVAGLVGLVIGMLLLRLRAAYLALFTIAFSELFRIVMLTEYDYTGGSNGLSLRPLLQIADVETARQVEYYLMFALLIVCLLAMYWVANSQVGLFLRAMREDEDAASALGVNVVRYKILVFVFTSMIVGLAGAIFYSDIGSERIIPEQLEVLQMSLIIAYAVIGGMESLIGAAAGAFISRYLLEATREVVITYPFGLTTADGSNAFVWEPGAWRYALFGFVMVLTLRFMRNGLLYPFITWFSGRDLVMKETVAKRESDEDHAARQGADDE
ncbi:MAG: branched-chain amino acid ABC transporter permease [Chloroflexi bacterium]|nr:branched-chain amino acid ABC transporter permease [Chloroflexota bacterium]MCY3583203.1 branched-chain amino acid ABC transporter permease [Chloroflexota bacterium]MCY3715960.1 branched-chain amino acid ABC transporter permease [Chloroflexota bacterium]MDE2651531.1 branched-chain amino acid ABC transporter permease [Chloroflexota bacterium]MXX49774.1 branched-chain amino acid ABC transporter permease [Chloroflexota bacterium]